ncbi:phosphomannomutase/phosphoglucomutase [Marinimicrobium sp. ARAG 43.8]|uniref:phosphomannomutase/phosphoglucomutase n=1 Tax=Marinimicrobium sp. ARAG 43.8 TaxID=3418719 RepID=UPI003CF64D12
MTRRTPQQQKQQRARQARQQRIALLVLVVIALNAALGYWLYQRMVVESGQERLVASTQNQAVQAARTLQRFLTDTQNQVAQLAAEPATLTALTDSASQAAYQATLEKQLEQVLAVRLIPAGQAELDRNHAVPLRFAEVDLIRRAERREMYRPELARIEQQWQLHVIAPVPPAPGEPVAGTLLVTFDEPSWRAPLSTLDPTLGRVELTQRIFDSATLTVYQRGEEGGGVSHEVPIANSHWTLTFTASPALVEQTREPPTLWLLILSATSIGGLLGAWLAGHLMKSRALPRQKDNAHTSSATTHDAPTTKERDEDDVMASPLFQNQDILDIEVSDEDEDILALDNTTMKRAPTKSPVVDDSPAPDSIVIPDGIFRSYDIRGLADTQLTPELAEHIGRALGTEALEQGETAIVVARDGRTHSPALAEALCEGLLSTGCDVIDLGIVPTPLMHFATHHLPETSSGVMVTASHNPAPYNGFKMIINGVTLADDSVLDVRARIEHQRYREGQGARRAQDITDDYIERIFSDVAMAGDISLVFDAGNAVTGIVGPRLFEELGCTVTPLFCELDGHFPNHDPDPTQPSNLQALIDQVRETGADLGAALDGDGDRLVVVTPKGQIIWPDQLMMLFARDVLTRHPGADVLFDVKCTRQLSQLITSYGGRPIMWKTGHSHMKSKMIETGALIGGEYSGHIFIKDRWYGFDDGLYTLARLLEIITLRDQSIDDIFAAFPALPATPELKIPVDDREKFTIVERLAREGEFRSGKLTTIDGVRVDFARGWGLVRASNTSAALTLRFEADSEDALEKLQQLFLRELLKIAPDLKIDL